MLYFYTKNISHYKKFQHWRLFIGSARKSANYSMKLPATCTGQNLGIILRELLSEFYHNCPEKQPQSLPTLTIYAKLVNFLFPLCWQPAKISSFKGVEVGVALELEMQGEKIGSKNHFISYNTVLQHSLLK